MARETPEPRESIAPVGPFVLDMPEPDRVPHCTTCCRDLDQCPGHDGDPDLMDIVCALVNALAQLPGLHPVPKTIVAEINRCEDWLRSHHPEFLPPSRF